MSDPDTSGQTGTIRQFYEALLKTDTYSAKNLASFQDNVLKDLLPFVAKNVPFYRERLTPVFRKDGSYNPECWSKLPILTAAELRANRDPSGPPNFLSRTAGVARYVSSGSTGRARAFYRSALSEAGQNAAHYRHYRAFKLDPQRNLAMIRAFDTALARSRPVPSDSSKIPGQQDGLQAGHLVLFSSLRFSLLSPARLNGYAGSVKSISTPFRPMRWQSHAMSPEIPKRSRGCLPFSRQANP